MICACCKKRIDEEEQYELLSCDGDFIHSKCRKRWNEMCRKINNMSDEEFKRWFLEPIRG